MYDKKLIANRTSQRVASIPPLFLCPIPALLISSPQSTVSLLPDPYPGFQFSLPLSFSILFSSSPLLIPLVPCFTPEIQLIKFGRVLYVPQRVCTQTDKTNVSTDFSCLFLSTANLIILLTWDFFNLHMLRSVDMSFCESSNCRASCSAVLAKFQAVASAYLQQNHGAFKQSTHWAPVGIDHLTLPVNIFLSHASSPNLPPSETDMRNRQQRSVGASGCRSVEGAVTSNEYRR